MKRILYILLICNIQIAINFCFAQERRTMDSLNLALKTAKHDTTRCNILIAMIEAETEDVISIKYNEQLKNITESKLKTTESTLPEYRIYKKHYAASLNNIGYAYDIAGNSLKALEYYSKSQKIQEEIGDKNGVATSLNNIAYIYNNQGDILKALEYFSKSLKIQEGIGDKKGISVLLNNIAGIYNYQGDSKKALSYLEKSLKIREEIGDKNGIARALNNIGYFYNKQNNINTSIIYFRKSLKIREETDDKPGIAASLINIGYIYKMQNNVPEALNYLDRSLKISEEIGDKNGIADCLNYIGGIYCEQKNYSKALSYCKKSMVLANELSYPVVIKNVAKNLNQIYKALGDDKNSLLNYELYIQMRDSISNQETKKASIKSQLKYEYEKKAVADSVKVAEEKKLTTVKLKQEKTQRYFLYGGLGLTVLFGLFMFNRFRITRKQKTIIEQQKTIVEHQKSLVDEKQKEILDSIHYAKRIQTSLLPTQIYIQRQLNKLKN